MSFSWQRNWPAAVLALAAAVLVFPLWSVHTPAMPDFPAHLAGFYLLLEGKSAAAAAFYNVHWVLVPNLASEVIVPLLGRVLPLETAAKLFLTAAVVMWVLGPAAIQQALFGRIGPAALAAALFAYNANFTWGFFNYYFSAGVCFVLFAAWIATMNRRTPLIIAGFALAVSFLFVCHLFAVCVLLVMIGCIEISSAIHQRRLEPKALAARIVPIILVFLPSALMFVIARTSGNSGVGIEFNYADTIDDRFGGALQSSFDQPAYLVTAAFAVLVLAGLVYGKLRIHRLAKLLVIVLVALAMLAPEWALGGWGVDLRLPAVVGAVMFACTEFRIGKRSAVAAAIVLFLVAGGNAAVLASDWHGYDLQFQEFRSALREIPKGTKLVTVLDGDALNDTPDQPYWHMAEYAIIDRGAFTPLMFTTKGQHVVQVRPPYDRLAASNAQQGSPPDVSELADLAASRVDNDPDIEDVFPYLKAFQCHFDVAVVVTGGGEASEVPDFLTLRHTGTFFSLYDIHPTGACSKR
jgi:hypothetical protein